MSIERSLNDETIIQSRALDRLFRVFVGDAGRKNAYFGNHSIVFSDIPDTFTIECKPHDEHTHFFDFRLTMAAPDGETKLQVSSVLNGWGEKIYPSSIKIYIAGEIENDSSSHVSELVDLFGVMIEQEREIECKLPRLR